MTKTLRFITPAVLLALAQPALAGGYWMTPPGNLTEVFANQPLSQWEQQDAFDTASECEDIRSGEITGAEQQLKNERNHPGWKIHSHMRTGAARLQGAIDSLCISTDDPRLKP
jgi:hypothetical protein